MFAARPQFWYQAPSGAAWGNNLYFPNTATQFLSKVGTTNLNTWKATTGYTIEYWGYWTAFSASINGGPGNQDGNGTNYWSFGPITGGMLEFYYWGSGQQYFNTATGAIPLNTWTNIAAVFTTTGTSTTANLYINGVRQNIQWNKTGSFAQTQTVTNGVVGTSVVFGMGKYGSNKFGGYIDNLRASNINRYSGASYTLATGPFTSDSSTQLLIQPTDAVGSTTISYQAAPGNGTMTNASNQVSVVNTHANHT